MKTDRAEDRSERRERFGEGIGVRLGALILVMFGPKASRRRGGRL